MNWLQADAVGAEFVRTESWRRSGSAAGLLELVTAYMEQKGIGKSPVDKLDVVEAVLKLTTSKPEPVASPEENAWDADQVQGFGDQRRMDELMLANQVRNTSMADWAG